MATQEKFIRQGGDVLNGLRESEWFARLFGLSLALGAWIALASVFPNNLMPFPIETIRIAWDLVASGTAWIHLRDTMFRTFWGFLGAMVLGTAIGVIMGSDRYAQKFFTPYVVFGMSVPSIAWAAITFLIFGFTAMAPISAAMMVVFPYVAINIWKGVESIESDLVNMSASFDISRTRLLRRLILPSVAPAIFAAVRFGLAVAWKIVTVAEMFAASTGVGYKLVQAYSLYQYEEAWAWALLFMLIVLGIEYAILRPIERRIFEYRTEAEFSGLGG